MLPANQNRRWVRKPKVWARKLWIPVRKLVRKLVAALTAVVCRLLPRGRTGLSTALVPPSHELLRTLV